MEDTILTENPQQTLEQVREAAALLELIPRLLEENAKLRAQADEATTEADRLRAEVEPLRAEVQRGRGDREDLAEAFGKVMGEMGQIMGEFAPRFRLPYRPSPFAREPHFHAGNGAANGTLNGVPNGGATSPR